MGSYDQEEERNRKDCELFDKIQDILDEHEELKQEVEALRKPDFRYMPLAIIIVFLSYLYGVTLGVYVCPK